MELAYKRRPLVLGTALFIGVFTGLLWLIGQAAEWVFLVLDAR
jgi:hypothetical protein